VGPSAEFRRTGRDDPGPIVARGDVPGGSWELHAKYDRQLPDGGEASFLIQFRNDRGYPTKGGGCAGFDLADDQLPVELIISRRGPGASFCYVGQALESATKVELALTDGTVVDAELADSELPIRLWVGFTDGAAVPTHVRVVGPQGELGMNEIDEDWPGKGTTVWLPDG
jgi:hypothetical protein